jgi:steroid delta-isomerase-like uncharacterized protein
MPTQDFTAQTRQIFEEVLNKGELDVADDLLAKNCVGHSGSEEIRGPEGFKQFVQGFRTAFPDLRFTIQEIVAQGNTVVTRYTSKGTQRGPLQGIAPTDKTATLTGISIGHFGPDGKLSEWFLNFDELGLLRQLGVVPAGMPATMPMGTAAQPQEQQRPHG